MKNSQSKGMKGDMEMTTFIRYANIEDVEAMALIHSKSFQQAFKGIIPDDVLKEKFSYERLRDHLHQGLKEGTIASCIVFEDDIPVGMQAFIKDTAEGRSDSEIDIGTICLLPEYWGKHIGSEFIVWGLEALKSKGYTKVALWVVEENLRARSFYEKVGFQHDGEIRIINPGKQLKEYRYVKYL